MSGSIHIWVKRTMIIFPVSRNYIWILCFTYAKKWDNCNYWFICIQGFANRLNLNHLVSYSYYNKKLPIKISLCTTKLWCITSRLLKNNSLIWWIFIGFNKYWPTFLTMQFFKKNFLFQVLMKYANNMKTFSINPHDKFANIIDV